MTQHIIHNEQKANFTVVDSHCHVSPYWFEPVEVLLFQMDRNGVDKGVLVQHIGNYDNDYLMTCVRKFPGRFVPVVMIDVYRPDAPLVLERLAKEGAKGVRFVVKPDELEGQFAIWQKAEQLGLAASCLGTEEEIGSSAFADLISRLPRLPIAVEHLGLPDKDERPPYHAFQKVLKLAEFSNVSLKVGGLGEICHRPYPFRQPMPFEYVPPFIRMAYEAFGTDRLMWGSDFPPVGFREGYGNSFRFLLTHLSFCRDEELESIFGKTAASVFGFKTLDRDPANRG